MLQKKKAVCFLLYGCILIVLLLGSILTYSGAKHESIKEVMRDAVLHETNQISFLGITDPPEQERKKENVSGRC